jgi:beta-N-acetylglucosaminidase
MRLFILRRNFGMKNKRLCIKIAVMIAIILIYILHIFVPVSVAATVVQEVKIGIENFPDSYKDGLNKLKELHPNWNFEAYYTGIDWNELIRNETGAVLHTRNVVPASSASSWKCTTCTPSKGWHCASDAIVKYFIDPRNFLNEVNVFQFEELSYNERVHKLESVQSSVKGTFLDKSVTYYSEEAGANVTKTYSEIIIEAAKKTNISPFHIKAKIIQEVAMKNGEGSPSVSGTVPGYEGYYNFFNYGAHDTGDPVINGLEYARTKGWDTPYKAIVGGAELIGNSYINLGQNTSYFFKFDVVGSKILKPGDPPYTVNTSSFFAHQYMTNLMDPYSQSASVYNMYAGNGNLDENINFIIPVYNNMSTYNKKPTTLTEADGTLYYANVRSASLTIRNAPSTSGTAINSLTKDDVVVMLERECATANGYKWDKVRLESGMVGYAATMYLEPCIPLNVQEERIIIREDKKEIKTTINVLIDSIISQVGSAKYEILDTAGNKVTSPTSYATGYKLNILKEDNSIDRTYTLIMAADVNGDAKISASDYVLIKNSIMETRQLNDIEKSAADANNDGKVSASDYVLIKNYIMEKKPINFINKT